jgi:hypothetical protein
MHSILLRRARSGQLMVLVRSDARSDRKAYQHVLRQREVLLAGGTWRAAFVAREYRYDRYHDGGEETATGNDSTGLDS